MKKILERMRMERLYQQDYERTMKRLAEEEKAQKEQEQRVYEEYMRDYAQDSKKFDF